MKDKAIVIAMLIDHIVAVEAQMDWPGTVDRAMKDKEIRPLLSEATIETVEGEI